MKIANFKIPNIYNRLTMIFRKRKIAKSIGYLGKKTWILKYHAIYGKNVFIGDNVTISEGAWIAGNPNIGESKAILRIGNGCNIGRYNEIYASKEVIIDDYVLTADRVYISDNTHCYEDISIPILKQPIKLNHTVHIGEGTWIGVGVSVIGANIGKHCVIGSNAVVTHDIPDYSVAVGIPAKVIKRFDFEQKKWINIK